MTLFQVAGLGGVRGFFVKAEDAEKGRGIGRAGLEGCLSVVPGGGFFARALGKVLGTDEERASERW